MVDNQTHVVVIGAGPGGYTAAFLAADMGMAVTLVDPAENPGGVCLYRGCIPSKALLHIARLIHEAGEAKAWGVTFGKPKIDIARMRQWKAGRDRRTDQRPGASGGSTENRSRPGHRQFSDESHPCPD